MRLSSDRMAAPTLLRACRLLFGEEVVIGDGFLDYLQPGGLKSAYRKRARETHPDRCSSLPGFHENIPAFFEVQQAYQELESYLRERDDHHLSAFSGENASAQPRRTSPPDRSGMEPPFPVRTMAPIIVEPPRGRSGPLSSIDLLYQGSVPERPLLFGHFLYYSGLTTWRTITSVLVQQKRERPRCGELGTRLGMLRPEDITRILGAKTAGQSFGEVAVALGLLNEQQLWTLLRQQRRHQKKFGAILVEKKLINLQALTLLLTLFRRHNRSHQMD